jgi:uncharacterized protein YjiS (DUF1127 family)
MTALRYYEFPAPETAPRRRGLIDGFCARLWAWAAEGHRQTVRRNAELTDPHLLRDIGLDGSNDRNWL